LVFVGGAAPLYSIWRIAMAKSTSDVAHSRQIIENESLIVAYAMSRLDRKFLETLRLPSWSAAFKQIGSQIDTKPSSLKNLRDEFDPVHENARRGWINRPMRPNRQRVIAEFSELSDDGLMEIVGRILSRDPEVTEEVVVPLAASRSRLENVAERLRTGRLAEEFFLRESKSICGIGADDILDRRNDAQGFDFSVLSRSSLMIEVKGISHTAGEILFTDREWSVAKQSRDDYWLVVVGRLPDVPLAKLVVDPFSCLRIRSVIERCTRISWRSRVRVA
jgi:hypothetical protein